MKQKRTLGWFFFRRRVSEVQSELPDDNGPEQTKPSNQLPEGRNLVVDSPELSEGASEYIREPIVMAKETTGTSARTVQESPRSVLITRFYIVAILLGMLLKRRIQVIKRFLKETRIVRLVYSSPLAEDRVLLDKEIPDISVDESPSDADQTGGGRGIKPSESVAQVQQSLEKMRLEKPPDLMANSLPDRRERQPGSGRTSGGSS